MKIAHLVAHPEGTLTLVREDGSVGTFDVRPYFEFPAFEPLRSAEEFLKVRNGEYFVEWDCGADLSADTLEAHAEWGVGEKQAS